MASASPSVSSTAWHISIIFPFFQLPILDFCVSNQDLWALKRLCVNLSVYCKSSIFHVHDNLIKCTGMCLYSEIWKQL